MALWVEIKSFDLSCYYPQHEGRGRSHKSVCHGWLDQNGLLFVRATSMGSSNVWFLCSCSTCLKPLQFYLLTRQCPRDRCMVWYFKAYETIQRGSPKAHWRGGVQLTFQVDKGVIEGEVYFWGYFCYNRVNWHCLLLCLFEDKNISKVFDVGLY